MPPTPKCVLMALADIAKHDDGTGCFPSLPALCEWTCFSRRAVIDAIAWLEASGAIKADRSNGRHTTYQVTPSSYVQPVQQAHRCSSRTGAANDTTGAAPAPDPCSSRTTPVQQPHPNHQEPSRTIEATKKKRASAPAPDQSVADLLTDADPAVVSDWLALRKAKRAPVTVTVAQHAIAEAAKAGMSLTAFLRIWCARGSQGLEAAWLRPNERAQAQPGRHSAAADLRGINYGTTRDEDIPAHLRPRDVKNAAA